METKRLRELQSDIENEYAGAQVRAQSAGDNIPEKTLWSGWATKFRRWADIIDKALEDSYE